MRFSFPHLLFHRLCPAGHTNRRSQCIDNRAAENYTGTRLLAPSFAESGGKGPAGALVRPPKTAPPIANTLPRHAASKPEEQVDE
jgi:hypothetical protein